MRRVIQEQDGLSRKFGKRLEFAKNPAFQKQRFSLGIDIDEGAMPSAASLIVAPCRRSANKLRRPLGFR